MFARAPNQPLEPPRRRIVEVLYAEVLAEALGLNPLENEEEENADEVLRRFYREVVEEVDREKAQSKKATKSTEARGENTYYH